MSSIGIGDLISKNVTEIDSLVKTFIKSSLNIREGIVQGVDPDISMLSLIRDTYMCNLIHRYIGMMTLISADPVWEKIDYKMSEYIQDYYNYDKFKSRLIELYDHYTDIYKKHNRDGDYCKFLAKMINKGEISQEGVSIKKTIRMLENKVFNFININPTVKISTRHLKRVPPQFEVKQGKAIILKRTNYRT